MHQGFAATPNPPYYAVIFTSQRTDQDVAGYDRMANAMVELALTQPGCLGAEHARGVTVAGITLAYFTDEAAIRAWKLNAQHRAAQQAGEGALVFPL